MGYFFAIWAYLITVSVTGPAAVDGISQGLYFAALLARFLTVLLLCALVIRDILHPAGDLVRAGGEDDPAGGVLAGTPDRVVLRLRRQRGRAADWTEERGSEERATGRRGKAAGIAPPEAQS